MRLLFKTVIASALISLSFAVCHAAPLKDCFDAPLEYAIHYERELSSAENVANKYFAAEDHLVGSGGELTASCACPANFFSSTRVYEYTFAGSPLSPGVSGYGYLTENVDIAVSGYSDSINSPDGTNLFPLKITEYPTSVGNMPERQEILVSTEKTADVCNDATRPSGGASVKRKFKWSVIRAYLYIKKPILGEEIIPPTLVVQNYACLYFTPGYCTIADAQQVSNIWFSGKLTAPLSCTINAGSTIEVDLGGIVNSQFVTPGQPPQGYTLRNIDISYHCDGPAIGNDDKIKLTFSADQGVVDGSQSTIAKLIGRSDLGVRMYDKETRGVALDGSAVLPITLDGQGNGVIKMKAAPVSTTENRPEPGRFEGNLTVKMELR